MLNKNHSVPATLPDTQDVLSDCQGALFAVSINNCSSVHVLQDVYRDTRHVTTVI